MTESRVLAVLFADVVDSTRLLVEMGDRFVELSGRLADRLAAQTAERGGVVTKELGDGLMATFPSASAAIDAAIELQQQTWELGREAEVELEIRVGVSIGDLTPRGDGDWIGLPAVEAARLCAAAQAGHILVSDTALLLARRTDAVTSIGALDLKGLDGPLPTSEVHWAPPDAADAVAIPRSLDAALDGPFVGRTEPLDELLGMWKSAQMGNGGAALLTGEPGVGKTRLTAELGRHAHDRGGLVAYGHCDDDKGVAYQPFVEVVRFVLASTEVDAPGGLARILPELALRQPPAPLDPELARLELLDAVRTLLTDAARSRPLLLVLEDLHWASGSTLAVLRHLIDDIDQHPVLVVMTYRSTEVDRTHPLGALLADMRRAPGATRISLDGFSVGEVEELLEVSAGHELDDPAREFAATLWAETGGNAFFLREVLAHLVQSGALREQDGRWSAAEPGQLVLPEGVRDVVGRRLSALSAETNAVLTAAAVIGRTFDVRVLEAITDADVVDALDEATTAGLVRDSGRRAAFQFAHALVRETLLDELSSLRRARLHDQIASALDALPHDPDLLPEIARHAIAAGAAGDPRRMAAWVDGATLQLSRAGALTEAFDLGDRAIEMLDDLGFPATPEVSLLFAQIAAVHWWSGDRDGGLALARRSVAIARDAGSDEAFGFAVGALGVMVPFGFDTEFQAALPEALARVGEGSPAHLRLRGIQLLAGVMIAPEEDLVGAAAMLVEQAEETGDANVVAEAWMYAGMAASTAADAAYARRIATEARRQRSTTFNIEASAFALGWAATRQGDLAAVEALATEMDGERNPMLLAYGLQMHTTLHLVHGDTAAARQEIDALRTALPGEIMFLAGSMLAELWCCVLEDDTVRAAELADLVEAVMPYPRLSDGLHGFVAMRGGDRERAAARFDAAWVDGLASLGRDWSYPGTLHLLAELAADLGRVDEARELDAALEPYDGQLLLTICNFVPASVAFVRGRLARAIGDDALARERLRQALAFEDGIGAEALARRTRAELAALDAVR